MSMVVRRCNAITASLFKIRHHFTPDVLKLLVHAHVFPHISYCLSVWGGASKCRLNRVQKCVNFAARLVTGVRRCDHISPALASLGWEAVERMVARHDRSNVHKALTIVTGVPMCCATCSLDDPTYHLGVLEPPTQKHLPKCRLAQTQKGSRYRAVYAWNALPRSMKAAPSRRAFMAGL